ncbi:hypothetical protein [Terrimonas alba]|uniref:hypothetical protein n=1 Tax=Terrimonas alba TaxID=3349636 RepID=UPI0035F297B3
MKPFYLLIAFIATSSVAPAQMEAGVSYSLSLPLQEMHQNIKPVHNMNFILMSPLKKIKQLSVGVEAGIGQYAFFSKDQDIRFPDGSGTTTEVTYSSNVATAGLVTRFQLHKEAKWNPYLSGRLGYANFFSKVIVADPENEDDCKPLDKKTPIRDHSFFAEYGVGVRIDVNSKKKPNNAWIDFSINQAHGTRLNYINVKDIKEHVHNDPNNPAPLPDKTIPLNIRFVNVSTQAIHEHQLAEVYNSPLRLLNLKIGMIWRLNCE